MLATFERVLSIFSMSFQGWSLVVDLDAVFYAIVSLSVLSLQIMYESGKPKSSNPMLTRSLIASASVMCVLSVASNFFGPTIQTVGRFLTMAGLVQESMLFGVEIGKSADATDFFGLDRAKDVAVPSPPPKRKTSSKQKKRKAA